MSGWKPGLWVIGLSCWMTMAFAAPEAPAGANLPDLRLSSVLAAPAQEAPASAVQPAGPAQEDQFSQPASSVQPASPAQEEAPPTPAQDYDEAIKLYAKGRMMEAEQLLKRAADAGHAPSQARYARMLESGQLLEQAVEYYRKSAAQGDRDGQYGLGAVYANGEGVSQDFVEARKWYTLVAEQGHELAAAVLANAYIKGGMGLGEDARQSPEALAWIRRAAGHDQLPALDALAAAYRAGQFGLAADPEQADVIVAKTNKMRGIVTKVPPKKSMLFRLLKGDPDKETVKPK